jgi:hypothetical protein
MREGSGFTIASAAIGFAVAVLYVGIMIAERATEVGVSDVGTVVAFTTFLVAISVFALASVFAPRWSARARLVTLGASTGGFLTAGVLGIFSIGLPLLVAGILCVIGWGRVARSVKPVPSGVPLLSIGAAIATGALLIVVLVA